jgi:PII-like signaling protein
MNVSVVRIYVTEGKHVKQEIFKYLHDEEQVMGVTVFRGITGFGRSGKVHSSSLLDVSLDLPVVIEFFDAPDKVRHALDNLKTVIKPGHVLIFAAELI